MKIACSTLVCPEWTLEEAANNAAQMGYLGLEMRAFDDDSALIASDPMHHDPRDVETIFDRAGIEAIGYATGITLDHPIVFPPVLGHLFIDNEAPVKHTKRFVDHAARADVDYVRIYPGSRQHAEPRAWSDRRIGERMILAAQTARNTNTRVLVENTGSYASARELLTLVEQYPSQWLGISYNLAQGVLAGDDPAAAVQLLGDRLHTLKIADADKEHHPALLGDGILPIRDTLVALQDAGSSAWVVYEHPRLWLKDDRDPHDVLSHAADILYAWLGSAHPSAAEPAPAGA